LKKLIERFSSINSLKTSLEREIVDTESSIQEYSNMLGEKIRINEELEADDPDFLALKAKFGGDTDDKKGKKGKEVKSEDKTTEEESEEKPEEVTADDKSEDEKTDKKSDDKKSRDKSASSKKKVDKKKKSKKGASDKWYNLNEIMVYNGMGLKGELELYFKAVDELKEKLENLQRTLGTLNNVIEKGLKEDMGCIAFRGTEGILEISFLKSSGERENFSLKSIYSGYAIPVQNIIKIGV
jgi:hypothetical protein